MFLFSLDRYPEVALLIGWGSVFNLLRLICTVFHSGCINLYLHQQCTSVFSASLETITFFFIYNDNFDNCEVIYHCGFDLHVPDN